MDHTLGHDRASDRLASGVFVDCCPAHSKGMLIELSGKRVLPEQAHISSSFSSVCVCVCAVALMMTPNNGHTVHFIVLSGEQSRAQQHSLPRPVIIHTGRDYITPSVCVCYIRVAFLPSAYVSPRASPNRSIVPHDVPVCL